MIARFDDPCDGSARERAGADAAVSIDFAEHRPGRDLGYGQPGVEGLHRPELLSVRYRQLGALAFLVALGNTEADHDATGAPLDLLDL